MIKGHRIESFEDVAIFFERISSFDSAAIECTSHTFFRLSEKQRKIFTCDALKEILLNKMPLKVGVQYNGNYAVFYKAKEKLHVIRIILDFKPAQISIVTFYIIDVEQMPRG